jgi:glycosyltransferase involved in cell wall biosynthesis
MTFKAAVICLCHNHEKFVLEAMESVLKQSVPTELIIVDDASSDNSVEVIKNYLADHPEEAIQSLFLRENVGNCKAFNAGLKLTSADFVIDLAADDILLDERVAEGVKSLGSAPTVAINFTNANYIDEAGQFIKHHYQIDDKGKSVEAVPQGDVFQQILKRYFICSPSMMYRASFLQEIGGYDEALAYEDFDIMIRLSRDYPFSYTDKVLVEKRVLKSSMSTKQYKKGNSQLKSTLVICEKAFLLLKEQSEKKALLKRISFEAKQAFIHKRFLLLLSFISLGIKTIFKK